MCDGSAAQTVNHASSKHKSEQQTTSKGTTPLPEVLAKKPAAPGKIHFLAWHPNLVIGVQGGGRRMGLWAAINNQGTEILKIGVSS